MKKRRPRPIAMVVAVCMVSLLTATACCAKETEIETFAMERLGEEAAVQENSQLCPKGNVIVMGKAVGIKLFSDGVLVVGLSEVETKQGACSPGKECGLKAGDVITHINGTEVDTIEEIQDVMAKQRQQPLTIQAVRSQQALQLTAVPAENRQGVYQLGVWLRDSMAGIGTMTYYDPNTGVFAVLGHGINDVDTAMLMPMEAGSIMPASVEEVKKGISGQPGELHGRFDLLHDLGTLYANTKMGVFGRADRLQLPEGAQMMEIAKTGEVKEGPAVIRSNVQGDRIQEFQIQIVRMENGTDSNRNMMIRVTDPELLELTGGIVQGMSGSPILQNGKLVGAVTHVLVNDPTRGYGIFIENMLEAAK